MHLRSLKDHEMCTQSITSQVKKKQYYFPPHMLLPLPLKDHV